MIFTIIALNKLILECLAPDNHQSSRVNLNSFFLNRFYTHILDLMQSKYKLLMYATLSIINKNKEK